jgi:cysteine desulfurase
LTSGRAALLAIGSKHEEAHGRILFKLLHCHTTEDVDYPQEVLPKAASRLKKISFWRLNRFSFSEPLS